MRDDRKHAGVRRCAIYTRKSSEEGLDQEFNSLQAQREACEAFVASQSQEGWTTIEAAYDDGGFSGGTLERPALKRLMDEIRVGGVDTVVVYKIDRLTRSLFDFAKLVELFDRHDVSFVSVTQQFNTTTSMGRLTLNVLLSFAQFEREVTGERIRDKIAASKKKGMWMGGNVPLGYDASERKLVVNAAEAETIRSLYRLYADLRSVRKLKEEADRLGLRSREHCQRNGKIIGGTPFSRGHLYRILSNAIYTGCVGHRGKIYPGEHDSIIDQVLWDQVQETLRTNRVNRHCRSNAKEPSLLAGLLFDENGNRYSPSHAVNHGKRYRYYVEQTSASKKGSRQTPKRLPAHEIEKAVCDALTNLLTAPDNLLEAADLSNASPDVIRGVLDRAEELAAEKQMPDLVRRIVRRVIPGRTSLQIDLDRRALKTALGVEVGHSHENVWSLDVPMAVKIRGVETRLVIEPAAARSNFEPDQSLIKVLARANNWFERLASGRAKSIRQIAEEEGVTGRYVSRLLPLAHLAPDITESIIAGSQPIDLTAETLTRMQSLPLSWDEQREVLGF